MADRFFLLGWGWLVLCLGLTAEVDCSAKTERLCQMAAQVPLAPGVPKGSDVLMRSLQPHPANANDKHNTLEAIRGFHVNRLEWSYGFDAKQIQQVKAQGCDFYGAAAAHTVALEKTCSEMPVSVFLKLGIKNFYGNPVIARWMRTWTSGSALWCCMNNPQYRQGYLQYIKNYLDQGITGMHRDGARGNWQMVGQCACFCDYCMAEFKEYLKEHSTQEQRQQWGIANLEKFDYRRILKRDKAPSSDDFETWDGGQLKELFIAFQLESTLEFYRWLFPRVNEYAGREISWSANNHGYMWNEVFDLFDYGMGELFIKKGDTAYTSPEMLYKMAQEAHRRGKGQTVTSPKYFVLPKDWDEYRDLTRKTIATGYAVGMPVLAPWDAYMPNLPRYFGQVKDYADLYGFVRGAAQYLDGYADAGALGGKIEDKRYGEHGPLQVEGGDKLYAYVRAKPADKKAPVVIHLVEWGQGTQQVTVRLDKQRFWGKTDLAIIQLTPKEYDAALHAQAEKSHEYRLLVQESDLKVKQDERQAQVQLSAPTPWTVLVVQVK